MYRNAFGVQKYIKNANLPKNFGWFAFFMYFCILFSRNHHKHIS